MGRTAIHPGEHLAEELAELKMSAAELARQIDVPVNRITEIMNGQRSITSDTAIRLGHWFGTSAEFWLNLQKLYELRVAQKEIGAVVAKLPRLQDRKSSEGRPSVSFGLSINAFGAIGYLQRMQSGEMSLKVPQGTHYRFADQSTGRERCLQTGRVSPAQFDEPTFRSSD